MRHRPRGRESGQAAVEAALTLPLTVFLVLGTLQLFLVLQARLMAEHAVFKAVRAGALSQGSCKRMMDAALITLLPTVARTDDAGHLVTAYNDRKGNKYAPARDSGHDGDIVWLIRETPTHASIPEGDVFYFDDPDSVDAENFRLQTRLVFWYPMKIPFANWVMARIAQVQFGLQAHEGYDPLSPTGKKEGGWQANGTPPASVTTNHAGFPQTVAAAMDARTNNPAGTYVMPIQATASMRMMTPARKAFFAQQHCR